MTTLDVDTDGLRQGAAALIEIETSLRSAQCLVLHLDDDALGSTTAGREAADLLLRRARQVPEATAGLTGGAGRLADGLILAAATFDRLEAGLGSGPR